ncbi:hypothetical protein AWM70_08060 [Paenibacillus yonginensis]|uniref:Glycosyl hydrolases family 39 N-terminal catalytic domain-containing protein n=1 Tax=Paenibacillus yonginensis TaxID=1462996 RepID=A0A1B1MZE4_9BACL|nr:glycosyl hydrolase [Paenibacillus yonginensis]ANS74543.1 hypothetical protein AWM70_08060 [Paenibacillus yonginensis]
MQQQLRYVQEKCPFHFLRFHGIFDDDMMVYQEDSKGNPTFNFRYVNELFDFLLSIGLKPFVELGFMPSALASDQSKTVFYKPSYTSPPKSLDKWCKLMEGFIYNCFNRYGRREIESWRFEFWNEPEFSVFWSGTKEEYQEFYRATYETLKKISSRLQIGAPGRIITLESNEYGAEFFSYCQEHSCIPDFLPIHFYPHEELNLNLDNMNQMFITQTYENMLSNFTGISPNPDYLKTSLEQENGLSTLNQTAFLRAT